MINYLLPPPPPDLIPPPPDEPPDLNPPPPELNPPELLPDLDGAEYVSFLNPPLLGAVLIPPLLG